MRQGSVETPSAVFPESTPGLLPVRMLNEFAYCPRLCCLEWVQGECAEYAGLVGWVY
jgi:hypothetical protein